MANGIFFWQFTFNVPEDDMTTTQLYVLFLPSFNCDLASSLQRSHSVAFNLTTKCVSVQPLNDQLRKYRPCSDFLILKSTLPRLLVEVNSTTETTGWPKDLIRMLLQGAAIVRFANTFLDTFKGRKDFVLVAIYIWNNGKATCHILFRGRMSERYVVFCI
jgi:hypothetical protein